MGTSSALLPFIGQQSGTDAPYGGHAAGPSWRDIIQFTESASGAFGVAFGELRETMAAVGSTKVSQRTAAHGSVTRFGASHLHKVGNLSAAPAVSVHAYSPPLAAMRRYEMTASGLALVRTDRAGLDW